MKVKAYKNVITNDNTASEPTKLMCVQTFECINPNCSNKGVPYDESTELEFEER